MLIQHLLTPVALLICVTTYSQTIIPRFEHLSVNDGLPHSSVYSILQDKKGFMWFGTPNGLCRYDGNILEGFRYSSDKADDVVNNFVRSKIMEDKAGNIWYSNESGIFKWDVHQEKVVKVHAFEKEKYQNVDFRALSLDTTGSLWLFNVFYGVFEFDIYTGKLKRYPLPVPTNGLTFKMAYSTVDEAENIWLRIVSTNEPYFVFNKSSHRYSIQLTAATPHALFFSDNKMIQAFDDKLVYTNLQNSKSFEVPKVINNKKISFYSFEGVRDNYERLWMTARENGLFCYDEKQGRFQQYHHDNSKIKSLPFDLTTCLFIDRSQNLWIGIDGSGVAKLDLKKPTFNLFPLSEGDYPVLNDYFTKCFYEDEKKRTWFGTHTNGLNILDHTTGSLTNYHHEPNNLKSLPGNMVAGIIKDRGGNTWIGSSGGISLFDEKKGSFETIRINDFPALHPDRNIFVYKMIQLKNDDLLAATLYGLVRVVKQKNGSYKGQYFNDDPYLKGTTTDVVEMPNGVIYSTITNVGVHELTPQGKEYVVSNIFLNGLDLRSVRIDETNVGYLWISTGIGLVHLNTRTKKYRVWNEKDGLANSYVYGSLEDGNGGLWISTNGGLSFLDLKTKQFKNYSYQDGLQSNEFNTQAFYKSPAGTFYFGGIKGFNWFTPSGSIKYKQANPQVAITRIMINNHLFERDSAFAINHEIETRYDNNDFDFHFAALDFTRPEANKIQYTLQGWDGSWITTSAKSVRYANLLPGQYIFRVKASNAAGAWSDEEKVFITIEAPVWKRTWFLIAVSFLLLVAIISATYWFTQQKAKRKLQLLENRLAVDAERNRISADMHDEIGSSIMHIALVGEQIQKQEKTIEEVKTDVQTITLAAHKLVQTMSEIIWALSPQNETLENLLAYIREKSQQYFEPFDTAFSISFPDEIPLLKLSNAERRNLYLVTKELLSNAMKHAKATAINLSLEITEEEFCFIVSDNGTGINEKQVRIGSNGIMNLKKRMKDINGTIEWLSGNSGTEVKYCLPR
jgi:signal transduction histidine kinase/ligand-binding sensor domain-containing protein